jgi:tRNA pseudouridine38-40 synthase
LFRYLFKISYSGSHLFGSQRQKNSPTVFGVLEQALTLTFKKQIRCVPCGRTDTGVHAEVSYCHCDFDFLFDGLMIMGSLNRYLVHHGIMVRAIDQVSSKFHALSDACVRQYNYFFTSAMTVPSYLFNGITIIDRPFKWLPNGQDLRSLFVGHHNFIALCNYSSDYKTSIRHVIDIRFKDFAYTPLFGETLTVYQFSITADGFLYRMVRHIVGILLHCMLNFTNINRLNDYFMIQRPLRYSLAPVHGLYLANIEYKNRPRWLK